MMEYPFQLTGNVKLKPYSVFWYSIDPVGCAVGNGVGDADLVVSNLALRTRGSGEGVLQLGDAREQGPQGRQFLALVQGLALLLDFRRRLANDRHVPMRGDLR